MGSPPAFAIHVRIRISVLMADAQHGRLPVRASSAAGLWLPFAQACQPVPSRHSSFLLESEAMRQDLELRSDVIV